MTEFLKLVGENPTASTLMLASLGVMYYTFKARLISVNESKDKNKNETTDWFMLLIFIASFIVLGYSTYALLGGVKKDKDITLNSDCYNEEIQIYQSDLRNLFHEVSTRYGPDNYLLMELKTMNKFRDSKHWECDDKRVALSRAKEYLRNILNENNYQTISKIKTLQNEIEI